MTTNLPTLQLFYENLIEELESMGKRDKNDLKSNLKILLMHLLKYKYQPKKVSNSWLYTITKHRQRIRDSLETSPSLKNFLREIIDKSYQDGMRLAADEMSLSINIFSQTCPFIFDDILDIDYLPNHD
jgi:helix-turn-helix protein